MEFVRSDSTNLAKFFQRELFKKVFGNEELESWIKEFVEELKSFQKIETGLRNNLKGYQDFYY